MIHHPASQPRRARRHRPRIPRWATGLTLTATALLAGAPAALAVPLPPPDGGGPLPPPPITTAAYLPAWAVAAIVAATIVLSVATTVITLSIEQTRRARRERAAAAQPPAGTGDILTSRHYRAGYETYRADSP